MSRRRHSTPLHLLVLLSSLLLVLAGCGGNSGSGGSGGSGGGSGSTIRVRHITLQLSRSSQVVSTARNQGIASTQVRQVQSGDAGFIDYLTIQMQTTQGVDLLAPQHCPLGPTDQETATCTVAIPDPPPVQFQVLISAFNQGQIKIFLGNTTIQSGQSSATITLLRNPDPTAFIPVSATPASLQQTVFTFTDGAVFGFGLAGAPVILATGSFTGNTGDFTLTSGGFMAGGQVVIGSCNFAFTVSTFPSGRGPQVGDHVTFDPCQVDAVDGRLMGTNASLNISATSETPVSAAPTGALILPISPPTLVTDEDTGGTVQITAALAGSRAGGLTFAITGLPTHGTAVVDTTGLVTYRPGADFNGSDRLVVTVTATFTDGNAPPLALGTVPIAITVRLINDLPRITNPGNQTTPEGQAVSLQIRANDPDNDALTYSATGLPPGLSLNATTGLISGTIAMGGSPSQDFSVIVTVSDGIAAPSPSITFTWTVTTVEPPPVIKVNGPPTITSSGDQTTPEGQAVSLQIRANDPDNDALTYSATGLPPGLSINPTTGLISGTILFTAVVGSPSQDFPVTVIASDGTLSTAVTFTWIVTNVNRPPVATAPDKQTTTEGQAVSLQIRASDPDNDALTYSATGLPPGLSINPTTGLISGTIAAGAAGGRPSQDFSVTVTISDGVANAHPAPSFTWTIVPLPPHTVSIGSPAGPVTSGTTFTVVVLLNADTTDVLSYLFELTFNPAVVQVTDINQESSFFEAPITNPAAFASGTVRFAANNPAFVSAHGALTLAYITFRVIGNAGSTSHLTLHFPANGVLVDSGLQAIGDITFVNGSVTVN